MLKLLALLPYNIIVVILTIVAHFTLDMSLSGFGIVFFIFYSLALIVEFVKSSNTDARIFWLDLIFSVITLVIMTAFMTYIVIKEGGNANIVYWFGAFSVLVDSIVSPLNSFKAALRDFGGGGVLH
jgi:hypothetical protein